MAKLVIFSGAGLSAESGIATFRGNNGLWNGHKIEEVCDFNNWKTNRELVHDFYNARRTELSAAEPNSAHRMMAAWQERYQTIYITQNIDNLLERAGCKNIVHLHGLLTEMECTACGYKWDIGYRNWNCEGKCPSDNKKHPCESIKGVKPNVKMFHEKCPEYQKMYRVIDGLKSEDVVIVTGTSSLVINFHLLLKGKPGFKIVNNLEEKITKDRLSDGNVFDIGLYEPATSAFAKLDGFLAERLNPNRWVESASEDKIS